ncbi:MAG TPA: helix-turn-helix transcriptional regulator [Jatrophihabitantaceae bacterium]
MAVEPERVRDDVVRLAHRGGEIGEFTRGVARILGRAVPFDGICMLTMDPATLLPTGEVIDNGLPPRAIVRMSEIELGGDDINNFRTLARSGRMVASLSEATYGDLDRSARHRELRRPNGFGDELRAVLADGTGAWGALTLLRVVDSEPFSAAEVTFIRSLTGALAEGVRRAVLLRALSAPSGHEEDVPGTVLLAGDNSPSAADAAGARWIDELAGARADAALPPVVGAVANQARAISTGYGATAGLARARIRTASGTWVVVRGSALVGDGDGRIVVTFEPIRPHELAPLIADAYELTDRERAVTQLVARGLPTDAIAARLYLSPWTVQDHLKSIFDKVGVSTRGELVARLYFEHHAPRLAEGSEPGYDGAFRPSW